MNWKERKKLGDEKALFMVELLKQSEGKITEEVRSLYCEKFGGHRIPAPVLVGAKKRLGIYVPPEAREREEKDAAPAMPGELREALNMVAHVEKLHRKKAALEEQIEALEQERKKVDVELDTYKPVLGQLRALQQAVNVVRTKAGGV